jgi:putative hemolysin
MSAQSRSRYHTRFAETPADLRAAQALRYRAFIAGRGAADRPGGIETDDFDVRCRHVLVEEAATGQLVCCFRLLPLADGGEIKSTYSAQYYELSALEAYDGRMVEMGRFCIDPEVTDPDVIRLAWGALTRFVDAEGIEMLFGCSSFEGTDAKAYHDAFAMLKERHLAPHRWWPKVKAPDVFRFARRLKRTPDRKRAMLTMPPLLRSYLAMGGWVSDHAVVDRDLNTLHVFTGLEIRTIPAGRARLLRASAG